MLPDLLIDGSLRLASRLRRPPGLVILTYHRVLPQADPMLSLEPDAATFAAQMAFVARHLRPMLLPEAVRRLYEGSLPRRAVCVTFDDGYANNRHVALPILQRLGVPASFFVATGYLDGGCMWNDALIETLRRTTQPTLDLTELGFDRSTLSDTQSRRLVVRRLIARLKYEPATRRSSMVTAIARRAGVELPTDLMMTREEVRELHAAGMDVGGHTVTHPILARLGDEEARREIEGGRSELTAILGEAPVSFAYPNGQPGSDYADRHAGMVRDAGFSYALSTIRGAAGACADRWQIPRLTLWSRTPARLTANLVSMLASGPEPKATAPA